MVFNPDVHHRGSIRLKGYDYSRAGAYFITICAENRECLFGDIVNREMRLNDAGRMIEKWYHELENKFQDIKCDQYIIMPNHMHAVIQNTGCLVGADLRVRPLRVRPDSDMDRPGTWDEHGRQGEHTGSPLQRVVQWFKTMTTNEYICNVEQNNWTMFPGKLWQRNYYEHIVRDENELKQIREYILKNPAMWETDLENPVVWEKTKNIGQNGPVT